MKRPTLLALCLALAACKSTPTTRDASSPPEGDGRGSPTASPEDSPPPPPDAPNTDAAPAEAAPDSPVTPPAGDAVAEPPATDAAVDSAEASGPAVEVPVTIQIRKRPGRERYVGYARYWTENLALERRNGDAWETVSSEEPLCIEACPAEGPPPECRFCSPPTPRPSFRAVSGLPDWTWYGVEYEAVKGPGEYCYCYRERTAPPGRYRVTLCTHPEARCEAGRCPPPRGSEGSGFVSGESACASVEFDFAGTAQTVVLEVRP